MIANRVIRSSDAARAVSYGGVRTEPTTLEQAALVLAMLDFASVETERIAGTNPMDSLIRSRTAWITVDGERVPICSYGVSMPELGPASAWMMTTTAVRGHGREFLRTMRAVLGEAVRGCDRVEGVAWIRSDAPRMLRALGATFTLPNHPSFLCWEIHDNFKLRRRI